MFANILAANDKYPVRNSYKFMIPSQILGLFGNIFGANDNYLVLNRVNLTIPVEMQLSEKEKTFSQVFSSFMKCSLNFDYFETKDDAHRFCIFEITDSENLLR